MIKTIDKIPVYRTEGAWTNYIAYKYSAKDESFQERVNKIEGFRDIKFQTKGLSFEKILINKACSHFEVSKENLLSNNRKENLVQVRYLCFFILRYINRMSTRQIGGIFKRNHVTIIQSDKKFVNYYQTNKDYKAKCLDFSSEILNNKEFDLFVDTVSYIYKIKN